jgi:hypothetical protein
MKYTRQEAERLKNKGMKGFTKYTKWIPNVIEKDGFWIVESKINNPTYK